MEGILPRRVDRGGVRGAGVRGAGVRGEEREGMVVTRASTYICTQSVRSPIDRSCSFKRPASRDRICLDLVGLEICA